VTLVWSAATALTGLLLGYFARGRRNETAESRALRQALAELSAVYRGVPVVLLVVDRHFRVEKVNELAAKFAGREVDEMFGLATAEALRCQIVQYDAELCGAGDTCKQCPIRSAVSRSLEEGTSNRRQEGWLSVVSNGVVEQRCLLISTAPLESESESERKVLICAQDITELKLAQLELQGSVRDLKTALSEKTVLIQEIHHRVKNNLAVISSLLGLKADTCGSVEAHAALQESQQRVHSIALIHEHLYGNEHLDRVNFADYARQLVHGLPIETDLEAIELDIEKAVPCALILNELVTNALKYAFPGRSVGKIIVRFHALPDGWLELSVEDNGVGLPLGRLQDPASKSLGLRIVGILTRQLDGVLEQEPCNGTRVVLRLPR